MIRILHLHLHRETVQKILFDVGLLIAVCVGAGITEGLVSGRISPTHATHGLSLAAGILIINTTSGFYQAPYERSLLQSCIRAALALLFGLALAYAIFAALPASSGQYVAVRLVAMLGVVAVITHRVYANHFRTSPARSRILVFGTGTAAGFVGMTMQDSALPIEIVGYYPGPNEEERAVLPDEILVGHGSLRECALKHGVDEIVVALGERRGGSMPLRELLDCKTHGIRVSDISTHFERIFGQIKIDYLSAGWLVFGDGFRNDAYHHAVKRVFDFVCALVLLILSAPIMIVTACLVLLESGGPVFYRQERVGRNGVPFDLLKFRSMRADAEGDGVPRWAATQDDRTTRVGRYIRKFRIDEIPQLINVLKGEMSLVGPRPERPFFVEQFVKDIPYYAVRHSVKPGITGWAQVKYHYGATPEDSVKKLQYDLYYVKNHTLILDLFIMLETVGVVISGKGAR